MKTICEFLAKGAFFRRFRWLPIKGILFWIKLFLKKVVKIPFSLATY